MLSGWCGANRFEHGEVTRHDPVDVRAYSNQRSDARLDSTVMTRYGTQDGAKRGYNPVKRGRATTPKNS
jgi:hypothetical protein